MDTQILVHQAVDSEGGVSKGVGAIQSKRNLHIRPATMEDGGADLAFIDRLQKSQSREVGFLPTKALEGKVRLGQVLIAEEGTADYTDYADKEFKSASSAKSAVTKAPEGKVRLGQVLMAEETRRQGDKETRGSDAQASPCPLVSLSPCPLPVEETQGQGDKETRGSDAQASPCPLVSLSPCPLPAGYLIAADRYFKRDEIGYVTQINVLPEYRRSLVAGALLQAQFDRSAYGCKLYCCWCAQDLKANEFWEAMGFTAIAFRTGSRTKGKSAAGKSGPRIHIFWQKRVRADDESTPWWYPSQTAGGELREDRLVFPIPRGVSWRDVLPVVLPEDLNHEGAKARSEKKVKKAKPKAKEILVAPRRGSLWFAKSGVVAADEPGESVAEIVPKQKIAIDPRLTKMARELRDRWSEQQSQLVLPATAKHDVRRLPAPLPTPLHAPLHSPCALNAIESQPIAKRALPEAA